MSAALDDFNGSLDCFSSFTLLVLVSCGVETTADPVVDHETKYIHHQLKIYVEFKRMNKTKTTIIIIERVDKELFCIGLTS